MGLLDDSIKWWKVGSGTAPYSPDQITDAIDFFERLTTIYSGSMSFIGPIPNEQLEEATAKWKAWFREHGDELTFDAASGHVIVVRR